MKLLFPSNVKDSEDDIEDIVSNLKLALAQTEDDSQKKLTLIKLLPRRWSLERIKVTFEGYTTNYITKQLSNLSKVIPGITPLANRPGRPSHAPDVKERVRQFYYQDHVSRPFTGMKDVLSLISETVGWKPLKTSETFATWKINGFTRSILRNLQR